MGSSEVTRMDIYVFAFPRWKWPVVAQCFPNCRLHIVSSGATVPSGASLLLWGQKPVPDGAPSDVRILRLEDGFLRSVGLGADLVRPMSWVVDRRGIYYDPRHPSDLEVILADTEFEGELLERARLLRERVVASGLTKYNVGSAGWARPAEQHKVLLIVGQVESDASIAVGAPCLRTNLELLKAVRRENTDAYIIYKPHPDVLARLRRKGLHEDEAGAWCDEIVTDVDMSEMLAAVDEVHVLTSLAGFEALLRGKKVTCYGQPFYSGWGLTVDKLPLPRRTRRLHLDQLVAGALILYPLYLSRDGKRQISAEEALDDLAAWRRNTGNRSPWWRGIYRAYLRLIFGVR